MLIVRSSLGGRSIKFIQIFSIFFGHDNSKTKTHRKLILFVFTKRISDEMGFLTSQLPNEKRKLEKKTRIFIWQGLVQGCN